MPFGGRPVAEPAIAVVSPDVGVAVAAHGQRMLPSGADLHEGEILWQVRVRVAVRLVHPDRRMSFGGRPVAEPAGAVDSPGVGVAVAAHGQGIIVSGADLHVGEILWQVRVRVAVRLVHPDRRMSFGGRPVAEPAGAVDSPGVGVAVAAHGQGIIVSGADLHVGEILWQVRVRVAVRLVHHDRRSLPGVRPVAELPIAVVSPGVGVAVAAHSQGKSIDIVF